MTKRKQGTSAPVATAAGIPKYSLIGPSEASEVEDLLAGKSDKEARQRLQALIAEWLRMENLVVLTGAGCSYSSGGKLLAGLEKAASEIVLAASDLDESAKTLLRERLASGKDLPAWAKSGFEDWLSYLANAAYLANSEESPFAGLEWKASVKPTKEVLVKLVNYLSRAIVAECTLELPSVDRAAGGVPPHIAFLSKLVVRDSNLGRAHLFTLNYDTLFEQAMELLGIQYFDGFTGRADARFDPSVYGLDIYFPGEVAEGRVRRFDKFLQFYKPHGSIHWFVDDGELRARHPDLRPYRDYAKLSAAEKAVRLFSATTSITEAAGIMPTANKFVQTLSMPFAHLFRSFQVRLNAPQTFLLVMGYGFGDDHITQIIETALMNPSLVMLVVEPNPDSPTLERISRYRELGKRAFVLTATDEAFAAKAFDAASFDDFAKNVIPDVQWLDDFMRLRRFEKQIKSSHDARAPAEEAE